MGIARGDLVGHGARRAGVLGLRGGMSMWTARSVLSFMVVLGLMWGVWSAGGGHPPRKIASLFRAPFALLKGRLVYV